MTLHLSAQNDPMQKLKISLGDSKKYESPGDGWWERMERRQANVAQCTSINQLYISVWSVSRVAWSSLQLYVCSYLFLVCSSVVKWLEVQIRISASAIYPECERNSSMLLRHKSFKKRKHYTR